MPSFFTSSTPKKPTPVFAGIDDPFNFPASRMKYKSRTSRTSSPDSSSATDSGYGSIDSSDNDAPLSPKSAPARHKRRLQRDSKGHWRTHSYEYQSEDNDASAERTPILAPGPKAPDNDHAWKPNLKHTFTLIVDETKPKKEKWFAKRVYGRALRQKERSEGLTQLQRDMAPVLRRAPLSPEADLSLHHHSKNNKNPTSGAGVVRPVYGGSDTFQEDPLWRDYVLFYEYFHGDNGAGLGASHQTGWTAIVARAMHLFSTTTAEHMLELGKTAYFMKDPLWQNAAREPVA